MEGNINQVIDQIANYLGVTTDNIMSYLPQYIAKCTAGSAIGVGGSFIFLAIIAVIITILVVILIRCKRKNKYGDFGPLGMALAIFGVLFLVVLIILVFNAYNLYMWQNFPEVTAAEHLLKVISYNM